MKKTDQDLTQYQVEQLQKQVDNIQTSLNTLLEKGLPNLNADLVSLKVRMNLYTAFNIGAIILGLIFARILR